MAATHLAYNSNGNALAKRLIDDCRAADNSERTAGMIDVWLERHADIVRDGAEVKAMIDSYR